MLGINQLVDRLTGGAGLIREVTRHHLPADFWPDPDRAAIVAILAGLGLALWGARSLRAVYVLAFMGVGAAIGIKIARVMEVDILPGLVVGAGLAALVGYLLYHWWVGVTAGIGAMLLVALLAGAKYMPEIRAEVDDGRQAFDDHRLGVGSDDYASALPVDDQAAGDYFKRLASHYWNNHSDQVYRVGFVLALTWMVGLGMGLTLPRFTTVVGTSVIGVSALALGLGLVISTHWPSLWANLVGHAAWSLAGLGVLLVVSLSYQLRGRRPITVAPPPPRRSASSVVPATQA